MTAFEPYTSFELRYLATSGQDRRLRIFDLRTYKPLHAYKLSCGASNLQFSQRGLLAASCQNVVDVYKDACMQVCTCNVFLLIQQLP